MRGLLTLNEGEILTSRASKMLGCTVKQVRNYFNEGKLRGRRNSSNGLVGHIIIEEASVYELARVLGKIVDESHKTVPKGIDKELSEYIQKRYLKKLTDSRVFDIDGTAVDVGMIWVKYFGPTGRRCLTHFLRNKISEPALRKSKFKITRSDESVLIFYKRPGTATEKVTYKFFSQIVDEAVRAAIEDATRHRERQEKRKKKSS